MPRNGMLTENEILAAMELDADEAEEEAEDGDAPRRRDWCCGSVGWIKWAILAAVVFVAAASMVTVCLAGVVCDVDELVGNGGQRF